MVPDVPRDYIDEITLRDFLLEDLLSPPSPLLFLNVAALSSADGFLSMSSSFGSIVSGGIQDVAALLPLLGTEQCETHVTAGLDRGYLYPAAAPLSIFGSLGIVKTGSKAFLASVVSRRLRIIGAMTLKDGGFGVEKKNGLSSIMFDDDEDDKVKYGAEKELEKMLGGIHLDDPWRVSVKASPHALAWNIQMILFSVVFSILGLVPYIHLNLGHTDRSVLDRWLFPIFRVVGCFLLAVSTQFIMQHRILTIIRRKLISRAVLHDLKEKSADLKLENGSLHEFLKLKGPTDRTLWKLMSFKRKKRIRPQVIQTVDRGIHSASSAARVAEQRNQDTQDEEGTSPLLKWLDGKYADELGKHLDSAEELGWKSLLMHQAFLLIGAGLAITGYVGCFSIVQGSKTLIGPVIWLILEIALSLIRVAVWVSNPKWDEKTSISFDLGLLEYPPPPTAARFAKEILTKTLPDTEQSVGMVIPAVPEQEFMERLISFTGPTTNLIRPPKDDDLSFFYTLTLISEQDLNYLLFLTVLDNREEKALVFRSSPHVEISKKDLAGSAELKVHKASMGGLLPGTFQKVTILEKEEHCESRITHDKRILDAIDRHYFSIIQCIADRSRRIRELTQHWGSCSQPYNLITLQKSKILLSNKSHPFLRSLGRKIAHKLKRRQKEANKVDAPQTLNVAVKVGDLTGMVNAHYQSYLSLSKLRSEQGSRALSSRIGDLIGDESFLLKIKSMESFVTLQDQYVQEVERIEIELQLRLNNIAENLSRLFGSDIKKQLRETWTFEVVQYLTSCKERMFGSQESVAVEVDKDIKAISQKWDRLIRDASLSWPEIGQVNPRTKKAKKASKSFKSLYLEHLGVEASWIPIGGELSETEIKETLRFDEETRKEVGEDRNAQLLWKQKQEHEQGRKQELTLATALELERLIIKEQELRKDLEPDSNTKNAFELSYSIIHCEDGDDMLRVYEAFCVLAGLAIGVVSSLAAVNSKFYKPGHHHLSPGQIVGAIFLTIPEALGGMLGLYLSAIIILPLYALVFRWVFLAIVWTLLAIFLSIRWVLWGWWWDLRAERLESARKRDEEAQLDKKRQQELGLELGLPPQLVREKEQELLRVQGLAWMRIRMQMLQQTLAKDQLELEVQDSKVESETVLTGNGEAS